MLNFTKDLDLHSLNKLVIFSSKEEICKMICNGLTKRMQTGLQTLVESWGGWQHCKGKKKHGEWRGCVRSSQVTHGDRAEWAHGDNCDSTRAGCLAIIWHCIYLGFQPHTRTDILPPDSCLISIRSGTILGHLWHGWNKKILPLGNCKLERIKISTNSLILRTFTTKHPCCSVPILEQGGLVHTIFRQECLSFLPLNSCLGTAWESTTQHKPKLCHKQENN